MSLNKLFGLRNVGGFSLDRLLGITKVKRQLGKAIGIPPDQVGAATQVRRPVLEVVGIDPRESFVSPRARPHRGAEHITTER